MTTAIAPGAVFCPCVGSATVLCVAPSTSGGNIWKPRQQAVHCNRRTALSLPPGRPNGFAESSRTVALSYSPQGNMSSTKVDTWARIAYQAQVLHVQLYLNKLGHQSLSCPETFSPFCGNSKFIAVLTRASILRHINPIHSLTPFLQNQFQYHSPTFALGSHVIPFLQVFLPNYVCISYPFYAF